MEGSLDRSKGKDAYTDVVSLMMYRVHEGLRRSINGTLMGHETATCMETLREDLKNTSTNSSAGQHVLNMRFALGADDTTYLNSAISMLYTGSHSDIDAMSIAPPDINKQIRKAVIAQLRSDTIKRRRDAGRVIMELAETIVFYLSFETIRQMLNIAMESLYFSTIDDPTLYVINTFLQDPWDANKVLNHIKKNAEDKSVYYILKLLETALDTDSSVGRAIDHILVDISGAPEESAEHEKNEAVSIYDRLEAQFQKQFKHVMSKINLTGTSTGAGVTHDALLQLEATPLKTMPTFSTAPLTENESRSCLQYIKDRRDRPERLPATKLPFITYCVKRGIVGLKGPLHVDCAQNVYEGITDMEKMFKYELPDYKVTSVKKIINPTIPQNDISLTYVQSRDHFEVTVHDAIIKGLNSAVDIAVSQFDGDYAFVPHDPEYPGIEARLCIKWNPEGEYGENIATTAALEHVATRCRQMAIQTPSIEQYRVLKGMYALMATGIHLRRLAPHAKTIMQARTKEKHNRQHIYNIDEPRMIKCTTPHAAYNASHFAVPYDVGYDNFDDTTTIYHNNNTYPYNPQNLNWTEVNCDFNSQLRSYGDVNTKAGILSLNENNGSNKQTLLPEFIIGPTVQERDCVFYAGADLRNINDDAHKNLVPLSSPMNTIRLLERESMHAIVRYALLHSHALHGVNDKDCVDEAEEVAREATLRSSSHGQDRRDDPRKGIWNDVLREVAISNDRLYTFIRTLSGAMGEEASVLLSSADDTAQRSMRALESERKDLAKRVADFQTKIAEIIIGGIVKTSHLEMRPDGKGEGELEIVDAEMAKELRALASGESGRPFFEANVAVQGMINQARAEKTSLGSVVQGLGTVVSTLYHQLQTELYSSNDLGMDGLSLLGQPRNSFMVHLRDDATAAIRVAYERFCMEFQGRHVTLYELIEGCDPTLCVLFAQFVAQVLIQVRSTSGVSALYTSQSTRYQTSLQTRVALLRLVRRAEEYAQSIRPPARASTSGTAEAIQSARMAYFAQQPPSVTTQPAVRSAGRRYDSKAGWHTYPVTRNIALRHHPYG